MATIIDDIGAFEAMAEIEKPVEQPPVETRRETVLKMQSLAERNRANGLSIRELIDEGRK